MNPKDTRFQKETAEFYLNTIGQVHPTLIITLQSGSNTVLSMRFSSPEEKFFMMMVARRYIKRSGATSYTFAAEVQGSSEDKSGFTEGVIFASNDGDAESSTMWDIIRPEDGENKLIEVKKMEIKSSQPINLMENLFDQEPFEEISFTMKRQVNKEVDNLLQKPPTLH